MGQIFILIDSWGLFTFNLFMRKKFERGGVPIGVTKVGSPTFFGASFRKFSISGCT